jgi:hypothetical protein
MTTKASQQVLNVEVVDSASDADELGVAVLHPLGPCIEADIRAECVPSEFD